MSAIIYNKMSKRTNYDSQDEYGTDTESVFSDDSNNQPAKKQPLKKQKTN